VRQALQQTAVKLGQQVKYRSAGTVEYVYDDASGAFYFLEVNTRLQVEHGVTEQVYGVDLVRWMIELGAGDLAPLESLAKVLTPKGHAIQVRLYAEDPAKNFRPSAGLISAVQFPEQDRKSCRIDHWLDAGLEVPPFFDPMLAKLIAWSGSREQTITTLLTMLHDSTVYGIETNKEYLCALLNSDVVQQGKVLTRTLNEFSYEPSTIDVLSGGTQTTIQDFPGRVGYWDIGVPPSGPMDDYAFQLANQIVGNDASAAGFEFTLQGPSLKFHQDSVIALTGAPCPAQLDDKPVTFWQPIHIRAGQVLSLGQVESGCRSYLAVRHGLDVPLYLGSRSTFALGNFGGHAGRVLRAGDMIKLVNTTHPNSDTPLATQEPQALSPALIPSYGKEWKIGVLYGPHGAPDFFKPEYIKSFLPPNGLYTSTPIV
jgi:urea carboxylase